MPLTPKKMKALKIKLTVGTDGRIVYPDFAALQVVRDAFPDVVAPRGNAAEKARIQGALYLDQKGTGKVQYDQTSDFNMNSDHSPHGVRYMTVIMESAFVEAVVALFPLTCQYLSPVAAATEWNERIAVNEGTEDVDVEVMKQIQAKIDANVALTPDQEDALDVTKDAPGITINHRKTIALMQTKLGFELE